MKTYMDIVNELAKEVEEIFPWDLAAELKSGHRPLIVDVRERYEFGTMHIAGSISVPRGVLESASEWNYEETVPDLVQARNKDLLLVCRSGYRSVLAAHTLKQMGFKKVRSLKTGLRGWNEYKQPMIKSIGGDPVNEDEADRYFAPAIKSHQMKPTS